MVNLAVDIFRYKVETKNETKTGLEECGSQLRRQSSGETSFGQFE